MTPRTADRLEAWAGSVRRLIAAAPITAVVEETGIVARGHSTPPERAAIRAEALAVVDGWLARDLAEVLSAAPAAPAAPGIDVERLAKALRAQVEQMGAVRRTGDASLMVRQDRVLEYIDALLLPSEGAGSMSPLRRRPYRDRNLPYTDAIQELADEADGDVHEGHCMVNQEEDPDSCNCALRWFLERAALLSGAAPAAGEVARIGVPGQPFGYATGGNEPAPAAPAAPALDVQRLPRVNGHVDADTVATIFMGRWVDTLSPLVTRATFGAMSRDLANYLTLLFEDAGL